MKLLFRFGEFSAKTRMTFPREFKQRGYVESQMVCLFGLDAVEKLKGKIEIDMVSKKGEIDFTI